MPTWIFAVLLGHVNIYHSKYFSGWQKKITLHSIFNNYSKSVLADFIHIKCFNHKQNH